MISFKTLSAFFIVQLLILTKARSQSCGGSFGDPIVNITFGSGSNPGPPLPVNETNYNYVSTDCPLDGSYTIGNSTSNCFDLWHSINKDHTGDKDGYFMIINAATVPSDFYIKQVDGLCKNTSYQLSVWVLNLDKFNYAIPANISFKIFKTTGELIQQCESNSIPTNASPTWVQYSCTFTTPDDVESIIFKLGNLTPGGIGNDFAVDDIMLRTCGPQINSTIDGLEKDSTVLCEKDPKILNLTAHIVTDILNPVYQWQVSIDQGTSWQNIDGETTTTYLRPPTNAGNYLYRLAVSQIINNTIKDCKVFTNAVSVVVRKNPLVELSNLTTTKGTPVKLHPIVHEQGLTFNWSPPIFLDNPNDSTPTSTPLTDINYTLTVTSIEGCKGTADILLNVFNQLYIPSAFSPNGDSKNDLWKVEGLAGHEEAAISIYNRYGQKVYFSKGSNSAWDGTYKGMKQPPGVYVYTVRLNSNSPVISGMITLLR